jgi:tetrahydromethanopterin S-methyltransferase subunit H
LLFKAEQRIFEIGGCKIGGQPGELPTVLVGNIFYQGMPEIVNHKSGEFEKKAVLKWINIADGLSEKTGVPHLLDVMASFPEAMRRYISFVVEHGENIFFIDGATSEAAIAGLEIVKELGVQNRAILNAVSPQTGQDELNAIRDARVTAAILLAQNDVDYSPKGRVDILRGFEGHIGLLETAEEAGLDRILIDTIVFDVPSIAYAVEAIKLVKEELGYPAGCSPANATYDWKRVQDEALKKSFAAYNASADTIAQLSGANFLIYGPLKQARNVIPACAMTDAIIAYHTAKQLGIKPLVSNHPLYRIF